MVLPGQNSIFMILIIDNYDSFTWNLFHYLDSLTNEEIIVKRNDEIRLSEVSSFSSVIISPGPGLPDDAGISKEVISRFGSSKPILGVCLGHQAIGEVYGADLEILPEVQHGVIRKVKIEDKHDRLFMDLPEEFDTGRYHSWVISTKNLPDCFKVTATGTDGKIMAVSHKEHPVSGIQFHPESVMTPEGKKILSNWMHFCIKYNEAQHP